MSKKTYNLTEIRLGKIGRRITHLMLLNEKLDQILSSHKIDPAISLDLTIIQVGMDEAVQDISFMKAELLNDHLCKPMCRPKESSESFS